MSKPVFYIMLGYPGAGKTTVSKIIHDLTGAVHLWADKFRKERYQNPTYSHKENLELYAYLNELAAELLATGQSVTFDTNFNFYKDREHMREIAKEHNAESLIIWVTTEKELAKERATHEKHLSPTRILGNDMPPEKFDRMAKNLQPPRQNEKYIEIIGENVTEKIVAKKLGLA